MANIIAMIVVPLKLSFVMLWAKDVIPIDRLIYGMNISGVWYVVTKQAA